MPDCIFCKIIKGKISCSKIYEDEKILAFLDISPINPGHTLVIPKNHSQNLVQTSDEDLSAAIMVMKKIVPAILKAVGAEAFNVITNNGEISGQTVGHTHFHIMPRFKGDGYKLWVGKTYQEGEMERIASRIQKELQ